MNEAPPQLPKVLAEIVAIVGPAAMWKLVAARGGTRVYLPARIDDGHWLVETVGREAADALGRHFAASGGVDIEIPQGSLARARALVDRMIAEGKSESEIALAAGYTERGVRYRKARVRSEADEGQGRLF